MAVSKLNKGAWADLPQGAWNEAEIVGGISCAVTGTATESITETDIVGGGKTIILTLTGTTWIPA